MKKNIIKLLIVLIFYPLIILAPCPESKVENCETGECTSIEELKKIYCKEVGDPADKFYNEVYQPAADAYNRLANLSKENIVDKFQKEKLPTDYGVNIQTRNFEKESKGNNYLKLGTDILKEKELFPNETVNCYSFASNGSLDFTLAELKKGKIISNPDEMYDIIFNSSCKADANTLQQVSQDLLLLNNVLNLGLKLEPITLGPKKDIKLMSQNTDIKLDDIKKRIEILNCKYQFAKKHCYTSSGESKSAIPLIVGIAGGSVAAIIIGAVFYKKVTQFKPSDIRTAVEKLDAKIVVKFDEIQADQIDFIMESYARQAGIERAIIEDLAKSVDLQKAVQAIGIRLESLLRLKKIQPATFDELFDLAKVGKLDDIELKLVDLYGEEAAETMARDFVKLAKYKI